MILPKARIMFASEVKSIVLYGLSQSPNTPNLSKPANWPSICFCAYSRHFWRNSAAVTFLPGLPTFFSTWSSIGKPWQSQPGTYGESKSDNVLDLTMMSFKILLTEWPKWISPFAYGGPSCKIKLFLPFLAARISWYNFFSCHCLIIAGSRCARLPRIGNSVSGKLRVCL